MKLKMLCAGLLGVVITLVGALIMQDHAVYPAKVLAAGDLNVSVLCSSCSLVRGGEGGMILLDQNSGKVWLYSDAALLGVGTPKYVGKINELGGPLQK
jgi:hypothetical protein